MNTELMTKEEKKNYEVAQQNFRNEARFVALKNVPTFRNDGSSPNSNLTASEIIAEAEIIYQWLIKTEA